MAGCTGACGRVKRLTVSLFAQLLAPDVSRFTDLGNPGAKLRALGVQHGSLVYLRYTVEREVTKTKGVDIRPFGAREAKHVQRMRGSAVPDTCARAQPQPTGEHMTIAQMVSKQTRIERQDKPECASLSFDGQAANVFQACVPAETCPDAWHASAMFPDIAAPTQLRAPSPGLQHPALRLPVRRV